MPPIETAIRSIAPHTLLAFMERQRWFGAKGAPAANARVTNVTIVPWGNDLFALTRVAVDVGGSTRTYQLPLAVRPSLPQKIPESGVLAGAPGSGVSPAIYDAVHDPEF